MPYPINPNNAAMKEVAIEWALRANSGEILTDENVGEIIKNKNLDLTHGQVLECFRSVQKRLKKKHKISIERVVNTGYKLKKPGRPAVAPNKGKPAKLTNVDTYYSSLTHKDRVAKKLMENTLKGLNTSFIKNMSSNMSGDKVVVQAFNKDQEIIATVMVQFNNIGQSVLETTSLNYEVYRKTVAFN